MKRDKLTQLRKITGHTINEFGKMLGVSGNNQGQIERGQRKPSASYTLTLMKIFKLNVDEAKEMLNL